MTAAETELRTPTASTPPARSLWRPWFAYGTGIAIEIAADSLEVAVLRLTPKGCLLYTSDAADE